MAWKTNDLNSARLRFIADALRPTKETFTALCARHGITRVCGYKWRKRHEDGGREGLRDRSRAPKCARVRQAKWLPRVIAASAQRPRFGPKKLLWKLRADFPHQRLPALRTIVRWLALAGRVRRQVRRAKAGPRIRLAGRLMARCCNDVWTIDLKGVFRTQDGQRVWTLTVRDLASRYVLCARHVAKPDERHIGCAMQRLFRKYGRPKALRMDNGAPFGGAGPRGWSRLSVQWIKLDIRLEYGRPGHPEDNPHHEQMHRVLKHEAARPASANLRSQQRRLERWRSYYNNSRPHEALGQITPAQRYRSSPRRLPTQPSHWRYASQRLLITTDSKGRWYWHKRQRLIGKAFVHETLALRLLQPGAYAVYFRQYLIGTLHANDDAGLRPTRYLRT